MSERERELELELVRERESERGTLITMKTRDTCSLTRLHALHVLFFASATLGYPHSLRHATQVYLLNRYPTPSPASAAFYRSSSAWGHDAATETVYPSPVSLPETLPPSESASVSASPPSAQPALCARPRAELVVVFATSLFLFCYVGTELSIGAFTPAFAVRTASLQWSETDGAHLVSAFWGSFALSRLLTIFISVHVSALQLLVVSLSVSLGAVAMLLCSSLSPFQLLVTRAQ